MATAEAAELDFSGMLIGTPPKFMLYDRTPEIDFAADAPSSLFAAGALGGVEGGGSVWGFSNA